MQLSNPSQLIKSFVMGFYFWPSSTCTRRSHYRAHTHFFSLLSRKSFWAKWRLNECHHLSPRWLQPKKYHAIKQFTIWEAHRIVQYVLIRGYLIICWPSKSCNDSIFLDFVLLMIVIMQYTGAYQRNNQHYIDNNNCSNQQSKEKKLLWTGNGIDACLCRWTRPARKSKFSYDLLLNLL